MKLLRSTWRPALAAWLAILLVVACSSQAPNTGAGNIPPASPTALRTGPAQQPTQAGSPTSPPASTAALATPQTPAQTTAETAAPTAPAAGSAAPPTAGTPAAAQPAPVCTRPATPTPAMTEGPFFKAGSPERTSLLEGGMAGTHVTLTGYVLTTGCQPIANARIEFWQADAQGRYDNNGYTLRGHQFSDASGRYQLETIRPGEYPGRTEHIHVKVQPPNGPELTTQLFFPDVAANQNDRIFDPKLVVRQQVAPEGIQAQYDFIVNTQ